MLSTLSVCWVADYQRHRLWSRRVQTVGRSSNGDAGPEASGPHVLSVVECQPWCVGFKPIAVTG